MTTLQEALPCPFCGKQHTLQVISGQELMGEDQEFWQHSESFGVVCDASTPDGKGGCGAMGGFKPTEDEAIEAWNTRTALAQQGKQQPVAVSDAMVEAYLTAQRKTVEEADRFGRPNVGGLHTNTVREACRNGISAALAAAPAPVAQQGEPVAYLVYANGSRRYSTLTFDVNKVPEIYIGGEAIPLYTAAPAPQAQDKSDNYLSGYCTGRTDLLKEQSAQLVTQPLAKTCDTCAHYQQGKHPGVSIHEETCYECRSYWGNKWEAKSE